MIGADVSSVSTMTLMRVTSHRSFSNSSTVVTTTDHHHTAGGSSHHTDADADVSNIKKGEKRKEEATVVIVAGETTHLSLP